MALVIRMGSGPHQNGTHPVEEEQTVTYSIPFYDLFGPGLHEVTTVFLILCVVAVAARFWSRALLPAQKFWWDDWTALAALAFFVGEFINYHINVTITSADSGKLVTADTVHATNRRLYAQELMRPFPIALPKISALFFYLRAFRKQQSPIWSAAWWTTMIFSVAWFLASLFTTIFACYPIQKIWYPRLEGTCINRVAWYWGDTLGDVLVDLMVLFLPIPLLARMQVETKRKVLVAAVFLCGYLSVAASVVRLAALAATSSPDDEYMTPNTKSRVLIAIEQGTALVSICLPGVFFLLRRACRDGVSSLFTAKTQATTTGDASTGSRDGPRQPLESKYSGSRAIENQSRRPLMSGDGYRDQDVSEEPTATHTADNADSGHLTDDSSSSTRSHRQSISAGRYLNV